MNFILSSLLLAAAAMAQSTETLPKLPAIPPNVLQDCQNMNLLTNLVTMLQTCKIDVADPTSVTVVQAKCACQPSNIVAFKNFYKECGASLGAAFGEQIASLCQQVSGEAASQAGGSASVVATAAAAAPSAPSTKATAYPNNSSASQILVSGCRICVEIGKQTAVAQSESVHQSSNRHIQNNNTHSKYSQCRCYRIKVYFLRRSACQQPICPAGRRDPNSVYQENDACVASKLLHTFITASKIFQATTTALSMLSGTSTIVFMLWPDKEPKKSSRNVFLSSVGNTSIRWKLVNFNIGEVGMGPSLSFGGTSVERLEMQNRKKVKQAVDAMMAMGIPESMTRKKWSALLWKRRLTLTSLLKK
ncbi:hypothetical protein BJ741DRAFT_576348 [Chytriomyces cf. hyalinus JEL632]|nr:hypothetical protein BJ741DRAFT_576348 [Chytriomyces cf. hyalinus JEL632]